MSEFLEGFLDDYFAESEEHLVTVRRSLLALEGSVGRARPDPGVTEELFRTFHSLKGIAGMVEHRETEQLAHEMETYLRAIREGESLLSTHGIEVLIEGARALEHTIAARRKGEPPPDISRTVAGLRALISESPAAAVTAAAAPHDDSRTAPRWECIFTPSPVLMARGVNVDHVRVRLRQACEIIKTTPLVTEGGAVAFRFLVAGDFDQATVDAWANDGVICVPQPADAPAEIVEEPLEEIEDRQAATLSSGHYVRVDLTRLDKNRTIVRRALCRSPAPEHARAILDGADANVVVQMPAKLVTHEPGVQQLDSQIRDSGERGRFGMSVHRVHCLHKRYSC